MPNPTYEIETTFHARATWPVAGVDEAGRGPLAGPVSAAAVILDPDCLPEGLDDSKKLTGEMRAKKYNEILASARAVAVGFASVEEIDRLNILQATLLAMRRAIAALAVPASHALIDGNRMPQGLRCPATTIVKGDATCLSIAAASIIAKVTRDRLMTRLHAHHPHYGFVRHMGYGTPEHLSALRQHGPCPWHRRSFAPVENWRAIVANQSLMDIE